MTERKVVELEQGSPEWHNWRRYHSMASETPAILGIDPWRSALMVARTKLHDERQEENEHMRRGRDREPFLREWVARAYKLDLAPECIELGEFAASLDGWNAAKNIIMEAKSPAACQTSELYQGVLQGALPEHYAFQVQHQLMVSGAERCLFVVDGGEKSVPAITEVLPEPILWDEIQAAWRKFWQTLAEGALPEPTKLDEVLRDDDAFIEAAVRYRAAKRALDDAQADADKAKKTLLDLGKYPRERGGGVLVTRYRKAGRVDYAKIPALQEMDLKQFRKPASDEVRVTILKEKP